MFSLFFFFFSNDCYWQGQLAKEQSRAEALSAEVMQLSAELQQATQAYNGLARL